MKSCIRILFFIVLPLLGISQKNSNGDTPGLENINDLKYQLMLQKNDSNRISMMLNIGLFYERLQVDSSLKYYKTALQIANKKEYIWGETRVMTSMSGVFRQQGKLAEALDLLLKSLKIAKDTNLLFDLARANRRISDIYFDLENYPKAVEYALQAEKIDKKSKNKKSVALDHWTLADAYEKMNALDSATLYLNKAFEQKDNLKVFIQSLYEIEGNILAKKGDSKKANKIYEEGLFHAQQNNDLIAASRICADISALYKKSNKIDSAISYALRGFQYGNDVLFKKGIIANAELLAELYDSTQSKTALKYYKIAAGAKDSLFGVNNIQTIQNLVARDEAKQKEFEDERLSFQNRLKLYSLSAVLVLLLIIAFFLQRNNRQKQKTNIFLIQQNEKIERTLNELKSTQAQLIQSEKMASLGELTAGIAHEIQNPLNFVNNFSEVTEELVEELEEEGNKEQGERDRDLEKELFADIKENLIKINHHGQRASSIVKGMLEHSRTSSGKKELTDINALADEYLRLAYNGLRAKDKSFNANFKTDFDPNIPKLEVIPQDIGRVLLNLINNAFQAVDEALRTSASDEYKPTVTVSTKLTAQSTLLIAIKDNGPGIPNSIKDKIFQPFFTTKDTGKGTGLGLSLAYDIVKAHGGELIMESVEGEGTRFSIILPIKKNQ